MTPSAPTQHDVPEEAAPRAVLRIPLWVDLRRVPVNKRLGLLHAIDEVAADHVLLEKGDAHIARPGLRPIVADGHNHLKDGDRTVGRIVKVRDARSQARAAEAEGIVVVEAEDWRVIPLENLVAARGDRPGTLLALAHSPQEARLFAQTLETGVHGIVLAAEGPADIFATDQALREVYRPRSPRPPTVHEIAEEVRSTRNAAEIPVAPASASKESEGDEAVPAAVRGPPLALEAATITRIAEGGFGDRVCVDCTSAFNEGEGLLVGSTARSFVLVHAETPASDFVAPRPFRVNAGAIHSYVVAPGGKTRYLSELRAGDEALAVARDGSTRTMTIGRSKVERRPHTLIHWRTDAGEASAVLQTAETVRLVRPDGSLVAVTALRLGDTVLVRNEKAARHFGMAIEESLQER